MLNIWFLKNWRRIYICDHSWGLWAFKCLIPHRCKTNICGVRLSVLFHMCAAHKTALVPSKPASEPKQMGNAQKTETTLETGESIWIIISLYNNYHESWKCISAQTQTPSASSARSPSCVLELQNTQAEWQHSKLTESSNMLYSTTETVSEGSFNR